MEKSLSKGYTETLFGRKRPLPEMRSSNAQVREFGKRAAMNTPIQGTAADLIKMAMVKVSARLAEKKLRARLILQVHDELIIECPPEEKDIVSNLLCDTMENVFELSVPLTAEVHCGYSWEEAKQG